ncbi:hypothetical protein RBG61_11670 [Paludicola sp. MB14-C6]|uniref:hypothetical protein n=1 Tax=Paludihabitans sp. MB14-C6 TaxID=3070656 RepID=UPI0027DBFDC5|nr:hypothetical protein [Paludicola sp. MB14-C6]WMJ22640.1 hypothetical protein RBG61_11670 [Paludicola sp. MB14-C6]
MKRFINADIIKGNIKQSVTLNQYAYVNGNPISFVDPFGLSAERGKQSNRKSWWSQASEYIHGGLDVVGFIPGVDIITDPLNGIIYAFEGDWGNAGLSVVFAIPCVGDIAQVGRVGVNTVKVVSKVGKAADKVDDIKDAAKALDHASDALKGATDGKYLVGAYQDIKGVPGLDAHHVGQKSLMKDLVENYNPKTAPAINVPKVGHTISGPNGIVSRSTNGIDSARQLLARDIMELRRVYDDIPNSALKELIELNKKMYPEMRVK